VRARAGRPVVRLAPEGKELGADVAAEPQRVVQVAKEVAADEEKLVVLPVSKGRPARAVRPEAEVASVRVVEVAAPGQAAAALVAEERAERPPLAAQAPEARQVPEEQPAARCLWSHVPRLRPVTSTHPTDARQDTNLATASCFRRAVQRPSRRCAAATAAHTATTANAR
jgi:hypothetical protein